MKSIRNSMFDKLINILWGAVEKLYALPEDIFDIDDDENAIIDE
jgi:hypothetical protein